MDDHGGFIKLKRSMNMVGISEELQKKLGRCFVFKQHDAIEYFSRLKLCTLFNMLPHDNEVTITISFQHFQSVISDPAHRQHHIQTSQQYPNE